LEEKRIFFFFSCMCTCPEIHETRPRRSSWHQIPKLLSSSSSDESLQMQQSSKRWNNLSVSSTLQISWRKEGKGGRCTCLPFDAIIMVQQHTSELSGGIEISPVDSGSVVGASTIGDKAPEGRVLGRQEAEIRCIFCILVARVHSSSNTFPLPAAALSAAAHAGGGWLFFPLDDAATAAEHMKNTLCSCYLQTQSFERKPNFPVSVLQWDFERIYELRTLEISFSLLLCSGKID
jgi:hypothetical protein